MKKSAVYVALLLVIVIAVALLCIRILTKAPELPEPPKPAETVQALPSDPQQPTSAPKPTAAPTAAPTPTPTPEATETPFETRAPIETEPPEETLPPLCVDGSFRSNTGTGLNIVADWGAVSSDAENMTLNVAVSVESYSFFSSPLYHSIELRVNGKSYLADSPQISYDGAEMIRTPLASFTVELPRGGADIEVIWHYKGSYSGVELSDISASTTL